MTEKKTIKEILTREAATQAEASKAFALAIIVEGLKPISSEEELDRETSVESVSARLWLEAAQGNMKAVEIIRDTMDGPALRTSEASVAQAAAAGAAGAVMLVQRLEMSLLALRPGASIVDSMASEAKPVLINHDKPK